MLRCDRNRCQNRVPCSCLVPVWSEFYACCGWRCERCGGTLNCRRKAVPSYEERKLERELFAKEGKR